MLLLQNNERRILWQDIGSADIAVAILLVSFSCFAAVIVPQLFFAAPLTVAVLTWWLLTSGRLLLDLQAKTFSFRKGRWQVRRREGTLSDIARVVITADDQVVSRGHGMERVITVWKLHFNFRGETLPIHFTTLTDESQAQSLFRQWVKMLRAEAVDLTGELPTYRQWEEMSQPLANRLARKRGPWMTTESLAIPPPPSRRFMLIGSKGNRRIEVLRKGKLARVLLSKQVVEERNDRMAIRSSVLGLLPHTTEFAKRDVEEVCIRLNLNRYSSIRPDSSYGWSPLLAVDRRQYYVVTIQLPGCIIRLGQNLENAEQEWLRDILLRMIGE